MLNRVVSLLGRWTARNQGGPLARRLLAQITRLHHAAHNFNDFRIQNNGEAWLVRTACARLPIQRVLDIGANHGEWLDCAVKHSTTAELLACEPQPRLAASLMSRYRDQPRVSIIAAAIGSEDGEIDLHCYQGDDLANTFGWQHGNKQGVIKVPLRAGTTLLAERGWEQVDLLKIDVEGMEMTVLKGLKPLIEQGRIGIVQFEFGAFSIVMRILLRDFYDLFGEHYRIGRLMPTGVAFGDYDFHSETAAFANYVACRKDWADALR